MIMIETVAITCFACFLLGVQIEYWKPFVQKMPGRLFLCTEKIARK